MAFLRRWRPLCLSFLVLVLVGSVAVCGVDHWLTSRVAARMYVSAADIPENWAGVVLSTPQLTDDGEKSQVFVFRMDAAAELYHAGRIQKLFLCGGDKWQESDDVVDMKEAVLARGVPGSAIVCDFASYTPADAIRRVRKIYRLEQFTIIASDRECASLILVAERYGLGVVAFATREPAFWGHVRDHFDGYMTSLLAAYDVMVGDDSTM